MLLVCAALTVVLRHMQDVSSKDLIGFILLNRNHIEMILVYQYDSFFVEGAILIIKVKLESFIAAITTVFLV